MSRSAKLGEVEHDGCRRAGTDDKEGLLYLYRQREKTDDAKRDKRHNNRLYYNRNVRLYIERLKL